jgi:hypothetical protein
VASTTVNIDQMDTQPTARFSTFAAMAPAVVAPAPLPTPVNPVAAFLALPATVISTVTNVVATVLSSFVAPAPGAPASPPLLWAVLAVVRREFFNQNPEIKYAVSKPDALGNITISLNETDADGDTLRYTATNDNAAKGTVALNSDGHSFTYTPNPGQTGIDTLTITASDDTNTHIHGLPGLLNALSFGLLGDAGHTATAAVTVTLNTPPTLTAAPGTPDPSTGKVKVTLVTTDADGDTPTFSITGGTGTVDTPTLVDAATGTYTFTYAPSDAARFTATATDGDDTDTFTVSVDDKHGGFATQDVTVKVLPADIASDPQAAFVAAGSVVSDQIDELNAAQAQLEATIKSIAPALDAVALKLLTARVQMVVTAGLAQLDVRIQDPNPGPTPKLGADTKTALETALGGPLTETQLDGLTADAMAVAESQSKLKKPLDTSTDAAALATWNALGDGKPVFSRVEYTAALDGTVTGRVFFVDPDNDPAHPLTYTPVEESTQFGEPGCPSCFTTPPPLPGNVNPNIVTFHVKVADSDGNVVTQAITVDRTPRLPKSLSDPSKAISYADILGATGSIASGVINYRAAEAEAEAKELEAQAKMNDSLRQQDDDFIDQAMTLLSEVSANYQAILAAQIATTTDVQGAVQRAKDNV